MVNLLAIPNVVSIGSLNIALLDLIALILILIALIVGYVKGFAKQILSILGILTALVLAFVFADDISAFTSKNIPSITERIKIWVEKIVGISTDNINSEEALREALQNTSIPAFLHEVLVSLIVESGFEIKLITTLTTWAQNIICFAILFVLTLILFALIKLIVKRFVARPLVKKIDKTLGVVFSVLKTFVLLIVVITFASTFFNLNSFLKPENATCYLNSVLEFIINSSLFENILSKII